MTIFAMMSESSGFHLKMEDIWIMYKKNSRIITIEKRKKQNKQFFMVSGELNNFQIQKFSNVQ